MAYSISISKYSGYPTQTAMRVSVYFTVTAAGSYYTEYEVYDLESGDIAATASGNPYNMSANGNSNQITSDFYKTISGLESGRDYYIIAYLYGPSGLCATSNTLYFTTTSPTVVNVYYYDGSISDSESSSSSVVINGPYRSDWDFAGWATSASSISIAYAEGDTISATSGTTNVFLYAVYQKTTTIYCYYIDGLTGELTSNQRTKIQYRCNTSTSETSTDFYNNITLPLFSGDNTIITTSDPDRDWDASGWRPDTRAMNAAYSGGQSLYTGSISGDFYAVYTNKCSITYDSNGGSGSMTSTSASAYYNAYGNYSTPTLMISDCTFTAPPGKKFSHWNTNADGSDISYTGSMISTNYDVVLYAIWIKGRPEDWEWVSTVSKGSAMPYSGSGSSIVVKPLTANEWLAFIERIESFYVYLEQTINSTYLYRATSGVSSGSPMTAVQANGARYLISQLSPPTSVPTAVSSGDAITASFINGLKNSLNSIE